MVILLCAVCSKFWANGGPAFIFSPRHGTESIMALRDPPLPAVSCSVETPVGLVQKLPRTGTEVHSFRHLSMS